MDSKKLMKLLEKRAKGFSYREVQEEFLIEKQNPATAENAGGTKEEVGAQLSTSEKKCDAKTGIVEDGVIEFAPKRKRGRPKKCETKQAQTGVVLVKRKVHTFFVPPDMIAIKMLFDLQTETPTSVDVMDLAARRKKLLDEIKQELVGELGK